MNSPCKFCGFDNPIYDGLCEACAMLKQKSEDWEKRFDTQRFSKNDDAYPEIQWNKIKDFIRQERQFYGIKIKKLIEEKQAVKGRHPDYYHVLASLMDKILEK